MSKVHVFRHHHSKRVLKKNNINLHQCSNLQIPFSMFGPFFQRWSPLLFTTLPETNSKSTWKMVLERRSFPFGAKGLLSGASCWFLGPNSGTPIPILPCHCHNGKLMGRGSHYWGSREKSLIYRVLDWPWLLATPWKINMEHKNAGLVQMIFLFNWVIFWFNVNFGGVQMVKQNLEIIRIDIKKIQPLIFGVSKKVAPLRHNSILPICARCDPCQFFLDNFTKLTFSWA